MAHDGQDMTIGTPVILPDLLALGQTALPAVDDILERAKAAVAATVTDGGRISNGLIEANQTAAHGLAWLATYAQALHQMQNWAMRLRADGHFGEVEQLIHQIAFGEYLWQVYGGIQMNQGEIVRLQDLGLSQDDIRGLMNSAVMPLTQSGNPQAARTRLCELMQEQAANLTDGWPVGP